MKKIWAPWRGEYIKGDKKKNGNCVFCELTNCEVNKDSLILYKSQHSFVLMNKYPYNNGHIMVIPKKHTDALEELNEAEYSDLSFLLRSSVKIIKETFQPNACNLGMNLGKEAGAGIFEHLHYHIVPRWNGDTNFMPIFAEVKIISEHLEYSYNKLIVGFKKLWEFFYFFYILQY